jgi:hypothetical protein
MMSNMDINKLKTNTFSKSVKDSFAEAFRAHLCDCVLHSTCALKSTVHSKIKSIFKYLDITVNDDDTITVCFGKWNNNTISYKYKLHWAQSQDMKFHRLAAIETIYE